MQSVKVTVPATSANLGPGFDSLGICVNLYARFVFTLSEKKLTVTGCPAQYQNEKNLAYVAFCAAYQQARRPVPGIAIHIDSDIPTARGLGSSSACIVGGVLGANALMGEPLDQDDVLRLITRLEGHPDNVAPALLGGFTASAVEKGMPISVKFAVNEKVKLCALIPPFELATEQARQALPQSVPHRDAAFNVSRIPLLIKAFETGDPQLFSIALHDRLHQPYREHLVNGFLGIITNALAAGAVGVYLSGAGPTIMSIYLDDGMPERLKKLLARTESSWRMLPLDVDTRGAFWEEIS